MSKETFDFSEALRRMKEGKMVLRKAKPWFLYDFINDCLVKCYRKLDKAICRSEYAESLDTDDILATDWEEVEG